MSAPRRVWRTVVTATRMVLMLECNIISHPVDNCYHNNGDGGGGDGSGSANGGQVVGACVEDATLHTLALCLCYGRSIVAILGSQHPPTHDVLVMFHVILHS